MFDPSGGPYSRYNARRSTPAQVAEDFISPDHYEKLRDTIDPQLIIGPRGIGKTTLLKMLLPEAIDAWESKEAEVARKRIGYTGVFIAADKMWAGQFDLLAEPLQGDVLRTKAREVFGRAAFTYMALTAFADAAAYRCRQSGDSSSFRWVKMSTVLEEGLAATIAPAWLAHPATSTFASLAEQMQNHVAALGQMMKSAGGPGVSTQELTQILRSPLLSIDFHTATVRFIEAFNRAVKRQAEPWVLLIDEFEFLPPAARLLLGAGFQGHDPRLSYKISLAPYTGISPFQGTPLDDWEKVELLPPIHPADDRFTRQLFERQLERMGRPPEKVLKGTGLGPERRRASFRPGSKNARDIEELAELDAGFEGWLGKVLKGVPLAEAAETPKKRKELGRAMPLVRLRLVHKKQTRKKQSELRYRHAVATLYSGWRDIYTISEGNPRWVKALAYALLEQWRDGARELPPRVQARAIADVAYKLYDKLKAANIEISSGAESVGSYTEFAELTPNRLLNVLGGYLKIQTHNRKFTLEVPGAFEKDVSKDNAWFADVLNSLVFLGAIVVEKQTPEAEDETIRLARMWAPVFELLLRSGQARSLKVALKSGNRKRKGRQASASKKLDPVSEFS